MAEVTKGVAFITDDRVHVRFIRPSVRQHATTKGMVLEMKSVVPEEVSDRCASLIVSRHDLDMFKEAINYAIEILDEI